MTGSADDGIIKKSSAISGALNPDSDEANEHAERYYASVRKMKTDAFRIAENTGYSEETIQEIKNFIFLEKHDLGEDEPTYFDSDYRMAQSWQRLIDGKNIQPHDLTLLKHEIMERDLMRQGYSQDEAYKITSQKYNYRRESEEYYGMVDKHIQK